ASAPWLAPRASSCWLPRPGGRTAVRADRCYNRPTIFTGSAKWAPRAHFFSREARGGPVGDDIREGTQAAERDRSAGRARPAGRRSARRRACEPGSLRRLRRPAARRRPCVVRPGHRPCSLLLAWIKLRRPRDLTRAG